MTLNTEVVADRIIVNLQIVNVDNKVIDILLKYFFLCLCFSLNAAHLTEINERQHT